MILNSISIARSIDDAFISLTSVLALGTFCPVGTIGNFQRCSIHILGLQGQGLDTHQDQARTINSWYILKCLIPLIYSNLIL